MTETPDFHHVNGPDGSPRLIACAKCPTEWEVSTEDPDSTLYDALQHAQRRHGNYSPGYIFHKREDTP
jgi:hypothetical protein